MAIMKEEMRGEKEGFSCSLNRQCLQRRREEVDKETMVCLGQKTRRRLTCTEETEPLPPPPRLSGDLPFSHSVSFGHHQCSDSRFQSCHVVWSVVGNVFNVGHNGSRHFSLFCTVLLRGRCQLQRLSCVVLQGQGQANPDLNTSDLTVLLFPVFLFQ